MNRSERRHPSTENPHSPIRTYVRRHTQTPTCQCELPIVSVSPHSYQVNPHTVAAETSHDNTVKHDIIGMDGGHKTSDECPKTVRPMLPRKAIEVNVETDPNVETKVEQRYTQDVDWVRNTENGYVRRTSLTHNSVSPLLNGRRAKIMSTLLTVHCQSVIVCTFAFVHGRERSNTYGVL